MITNAMEYLTENSLSVYPFQDNLNLLPSTGLQNPLPTDVFVDAVLICKNITYKRAFLYSFEMNNSATFGGAKAFKFIFWVTDSNGQKLNDISFEKEASTVSQYNFFSYNNPDGQASIKLVPGAGMVKLFQDNVNFYMRFYDTSISKPYLELLPSTVIMPNPKMVSTQFLNNWNNGIGTLVGEFTGVLNLKERSNIDFIPVDKSEVDINVIPGGGAGLYNPCILGDPVIRSINGTKPNDNGDLLATPDNCLKLVEGASSLSIQHTCAPKCTETQVNALAYYINRIKDGMVTLSEYANTNADSIKNELFERMVEYQAKLDAIQKVKAPFIEVEVARTNTATKTYASFVVGIYDPNKSKVVLNLIQTPDINVATNSTTGFRYVLDTAVLRENSNEYPLPYDATDSSTWFIPDRQLDCYAMITVGSVFTVPRSEVDRTMMFKMSESGLAVHPATSSKIQVVNPDGIYYTLKSRRVWTTTGTPRYVYTFTIDLFKANLSTTLSNTHLTTLNLSLPAGLSYVSGTAKVSINNNLVTCSAPAGNMISNLALDYVQRNFITFDADYIPSSSLDEQTLTFSLTPTMSISGDSFSKTIVLR